MHGLKEQENNTSDSTVNPLSRIRIVLSRTSHPGNIGGAARALKTMGMADLRLVSPKRFPDPQARAMASNALDVLESARVCNSLDEALQGCGLTVAVTARTREWHHPVYTPRGIAPCILEATAAAPVALVFGNESFGLSNEETQRCRWLCNIPANPEYSSLNLAAAVQVICYELRTALQDTPLQLEEAHDPARHEDIERFHAELGKTLERIGFLNPKVPKRVLQRLRRLFARTSLEREEVQILLGILKHVNKKVDQNSGE
jgi:TrmH family RNA methyltransferase